jgi:hypothetical protein
LQRNPKIPVGRSISANIASLNEESTLNAIPTCMIASK